MVEQRDRLRFEVPLYTVTDAARIVDVPVSTLSTWAQGYTRRFPDRPDVVRKKIKSAVTDSDPEVRFDPEAKPGISNLLEIMASCTGRTIDDLVGEYATGGYGRFKEAVAEAVIAELAPVRSKYQQLEDEDVARIMRRGALDARTKAEGFQQIVRRATGLAAI